MLKTPCGNRSIGFTIDVNVLFRLDWSHECLLAVESMNATVVYRGACNPRWPRDILDLHYLPLAPPPPRCATRLWISGAGVRSLIRLAGCGRGRMNGPAREWADCVPKAISAIVGASWVHVDKPCSTFVLPDDLGLSIAFPQHRRAVAFNILFMHCVQDATPHFRFFIKSYRRLPSSCDPHTKRGEAGGRWPTRTLHEFIIPFHSCTYFGTPIR